MRHRCRWICVKFRIVYGDPKIMWRILIFNETRGSPALHWARRRSTADNFWGRLESVGKHGVQPVLKDLGKSVRMFNFADYEKRTRWNNVVSKFRKTHDWEMLDRNSVLKTIRNFWRSSSGRVYQKVKFYIVFVGIQAPLKWVRTNNNTAASITYYQYAGEDANKFWEEEID